MGNIRSSGVDVYIAIKEIMSRASLRELGDAIRTAAKFGDTKSVAMFKREIERRMGE
jgi:hypothetical protein